MAGTGSMMAEVVNEDFPDFPGRDEATLGLNLVQTWYELGLHRFKLDLSLVYTWSKLDHSLAQASNEAGLNTINKLSKLGSSKL